MICREAPAVAFSWSRAREKQLKGWLAVKATEDTSTAPLAHTASGFAQDDRL
jgi:hypothetical protein